MFDPALGVSLVTLGLERVELALKSVAFSSIKTLEVDAKMFRNPDLRQSRTDLMSKWVKDGSFSIESVHALFGAEYDLSSPDPAIHGGAIRSVRDAISLAGLLGARFVVVHPSAEPIAQNERGDRLANTRAALAEIQDSCKSNSVKVAVELLPRTCLGNTTEELRFLIDGLDPEYFGVCLDTNHLMDRPEILAQVIRELADVLATLHISDYDGIDEKHFLPGKGVLDWSAFMKTLDEISYSGPFNYECTPEGDTTDDCVKCFEENFIWLQSLNST